MADFTIVNLTTAASGFASTQPSTGKTINASVTNSGASAYVFSGDITGSNANFTVLKGDKLVLSISASGHPFWIKTAAVTGTGSAVTENITNNGTQSGTLTWTPTSTGTYYYICQYHGGMVGTITVSELDITFPFTTYGFGNISSTDIEVSTAQPGWLTGRRPSQGQVFPRGVYNR